jgi:hypothetical protein
MKLDDWAMQFHILEINKILLPEYRWPRLKELLAELASVPRLSTNKYGSGIFIGWGSIASEWRYHHTICIPSRDINGCRYGYHGDASYENIASMRDIRPVFNVGDIPETLDFIRALASIGIEATEQSPTLSPAKIAETRSS